jgi:hypothetical protein
MQEVELQPVVGMTVAAGSAITTPGLPAIVIYTANHSQQTTYSSVTMAWLPAIYPANNPFTAASLVLLSFRFIPSIRGRSGKRKHWYAPK